MVEYNPLCPICNKPDSSPTPTRLVDVDRTPKRIKPKVILLGQHWIAKIRADLR